MDVRGVLVIDGPRCAKREIGISVGTGARKGRLAGVRGPDRDGNRRGGRESRGRATRRLTRRVGPAVGAKASKSSFAPNRVD